jgi:hypothetical protein
VRRYNQKGVFDEPVLRCDRCETLIRRQVMLALGQCPQCGNRRVRSLAGFNRWEYWKMKYWWKIDPAFFAQFRKGAA